MKNHYETLGLPPFTSDEEIKKAYRKLSLKFHPDKNVGDSYFDEWAKKINEAYDVLGDRNRRAAYDKLLSVFLSQAKQGLEEKARDIVRNEREQESLDIISKALPSYFAAKQELKKAADLHQQFASTSQPPIFTIVQGGVCCILLLIALLSFKRQGKWTLQQSKAEYVVPGKEVAPKTVYHYNTSGTSNESSETEILIDIPAGAENIHRQLTVKANQAYLYSSPEYGHGLSFFIKKGVEVQATRSYDEFYYVEHYDRNSKKLLKGWIRSDDVNVQENRKTAWDTAQTVKEEIPVSTSTVNRSSDSFAMDTAFEEPKSRREIRKEEREKRRAEKRAKRERNLR